MTYFGAEPQVMPDRVLVRPIFLRHGFTDDRDVRSILVIPLSERAPAEQRNAQGLKDILRNSVVGHERRGLSRRRFVTLDQDGVLVAVKTHWNRTRDAGRFDAR